MPTTTVEDLPADVLACALRRLDGPSLAAASCATAGLRALAADPETWRALCLARWPSLGLETERQHNVLGSPAVSPQRLFADAFPFPSTSPSPGVPPRHPLPPRPSPVAGYIGTSPSPSLSSSTTSALP